jgi:DNA-directed RNA polymerase beta subunit
MKREEVMSLLRKAVPEKTASYRPPTTTRPKAAPVRIEAAMEDDGEPYIPVGVGGIIASTEKLLALNRGLVEPDERDSYAYKRTHTFDKFMRDRIRLDAGKIRRNLLYNVAKTKSLKAAHPFMFDLYTLGMMTGGGGDNVSSLVTPLEEINPIHLVEQARRITQMGPGGIGSSDLITDEARNVHPSQFGFASVIEGPESERIGVDARLAWGVKYGSDGRLYQRFFDRKLGKHRWVSPEEASTRVVKLPD